VDLEDLLVEFPRRGGIAVDPVDLAAVAVEEQQEGRAADIERLGDLLTLPGAPDGPVEDEIVFQELLVGGVGVILLNQQLAGPSAAFLVEIEEQEFALRLGLGQSFVERSGQPGLALGRGGGQGEGERELDGFSHLDLLVSGAEVGTIPLLDPKYSPCVSSLSTAFRTVARGADSLT
jgi:hypothetical protein